MIRKREKTYYGPRDIYVSWACFPRRMVYLPRVLLSPVRLAAAAAVSFWSCRPPIVVPVSCVAAVPVVLGAHCAPASPPGPGRLISFVVVILAFLVFLSSLPCCSCPPPGFRPGPGLPCSLFPPRVRHLVLSLLSRRVVVVSCCSRRCVWSLWFPVVTVGPHCARHDRSPLGPGLPLLWCRHPG